MKGQKREGINANWRKRLKQKGRNEKAKLRRQNQEPKMKGQSKTKNQK